MSKYDEEQKKFEEIWKHIMAATHLFNELPTVLFEKLNERRGVRGEQLNHVLNISYDIAWEISECWDDIVKEISV